MQIRRTVTLVVNTSFSWSVYFYIHIRTYGGWRPARTASNKKNMSKIAAKKKKIWPFEYFIIYNQQLISK